MYQPYLDLRAEREDEPKWFDEYGVPRWCDFEPDAVNDIYANEVALIEIACQSCGRTYLMALSWNYGDNQVSLTDRLTERPDIVHCGDAPCWPENRQCAGSTMNCEDLRVVEFWRRRSSGWERVPELEIVLPDGEESQP